MKPPFDDRKYLGQIGENTICRRLGMYGYSIEKNSEGRITNGRGPAMKGPNGELIPRPDVNASRRGVVIPVEVKTKSDRTIGRITGNEETGIEFEKWIDYRSYEQRTGLPVALIVVEYTSPGLAKWLMECPTARKEYEQTGYTTRTETPDAILGAWLHDLQPTLSKPTVCDGQEMIYFPIDAFTPRWRELLDQHVESHAVSLI